MFSLSLGQLVVLNRGEVGGIYLFDLLISLFALFGFLYFLISKKGFHFPKVVVSLFLFIFIAITSLFLNFTTLNINEFTYSSFYLIRFLMYFLASLVIFNMNRCGYISIDEFKRSIYLSVLLISILGFVQLVLIPDFTALDERLGWDPHKNRLASTFFDPNFTGGYIALSLGLYIGSLLEKRSKIKLHEFLGYLVIPFVALILTFSRSSWGMFAVVIFVLGFMKSKKLLFLALILAFLTYFAVPRVQTRISGTTDPSDSAAFRLVSWSNALTVVKDKPYLGVGFNTYRYAQREYSFFDAGSYGGNSGSGADSSFIFVAATTGILGLVFFTLYYFVPIVEIKSPTLLAIFLGLLLHSQFVNSLFYPQYLLIWLTLLVFRKTFYT